LKENMAKSPRLDDVKHPDRVTPSATSRPIIVTDHSMVAKDPMMAPTANTQPSEADEGTPVGSSMTHERTIQPISVISTASEEGKKDVTPGAPKGSESELDKGTELEPKSAEAAVTGPEITTPAPEPKTESERPDVSSRADELRDPDAELTAEEAATAEAKVKREQELEDMIASGKYAVPINAVQRRRSRAATALLFVLAAVLALVLLDAIVDVGIVHVPSSVPHTHLFSKK
jgi:hypothetical protein